MANKIKNSSNSTKKAVALTYKPSSLEEAPIVSAKGKGSIADAIIEQAAKYNVPVVQNPDLTNMLSFLDIGDEIPAEAFLAVAEIMRYVYALKGEMPPLIAPKN